MHFKTRPLPFVRDTSCVHCLCKKKKTLLEDFSPMVQCVSIILRHNYMLKTLLLHCYKSFVTLLHNPEPFITPLQEICYIVAPCRGGFFATLSHDVESLVTLSEDFSYTVTWFHKCCYIVT